MWEIFHHLIQVTLFLFHASEVDTFIDALLLLRILIGFFQWTGRALRVGVGPYLGKFSSDAGVIAPIIKFLHQKKTPTNNLTKQIAKDSTFFCFFLWVSPTLSTDASTVARLGVRTKRNNICCWWCCATATAQIWGWNPRFPNNQKAGQSPGISLGCQVVQQLQQRRVQWSKWLPHCYIKCLAEKVSYRQRLSQVSLQVYLEIWQTSPPWNVGFPQWRRGFVVDFYHWER